MITSIQKYQQKTTNPIQFLKHKLDSWEIKQKSTARLIVRLIPAQCPFAKDLKVFGKVILRIPPLCKLNPVYEQLIDLRFRALGFLVDRCGEDITAYC